MNYRLKRKVQTLRRPLMQGPRALSDESGANDSPPCFSAHRPEVAMSAARGPVIEPPLSATRSVAAKSSTDGQATKPKETGSNPVGRGQGGGATDEGRFVEGNETEKARILETGADQALGVIDAIGMSARIRSRRPDRQATTGEQHLVELKRRRGLVSGSRAARHESLLGWIGLD